MAIPLYHVLRGELETALRITVSLSPGLTTAEITIIRALLYEAANAMGDVGTGRNNCNCGEHLLYNKFNQLLDVLSSG